MINYYLAQVVRKNNGNWEDFRNHQYDAYNASNGDIVDMPWGERALVIEVQHGVVYLDGDYTDEEIEDGADIVPGVKYVFYTEDGIYHTQFYMGDMYSYDYPDINEYHHKSPYEINPNTYDIGGSFDPSDPEPDMDTIKKQIAYFE